MGFVAFGFMGKHFLIVVILLTITLEYDFERKTSRERFRNQANEVNRLKEFCEKKRLCMEVDGEEVVSDKEERKETTNAFQRRFRGHR